MRMSVRVKDSESEREPERESVSVWVWVRAKARVRATATATARVEYKSESKSQKERWEVYTGYQIRGRGARQEARGPKKDWQEEEVGGTSGGRFQVRGNLGGTIHC